MKRKLSAVLLVLAASLGLSVGAAAPAFAAPAGAASTLRTDVEDFSFASYDADYFLSRAADGTSQLRTEETLVAQFPDFDQNRGIIRAIPDEYNGIPLNTSVESVVDENGEPVYYETDRSDGFVELALGTDEYLRGDHTFSISYIQSDVVREFEDTASQELYWDTNGTGFAQPFGTLDARFHIAPELVDSMTGNAACYVGSEGSGESCTLAQTVDDTGAVFSAAATDLGPGENVTVAIGFDTGTFTVPEPPRPAAWAYIVPIALMILIGLLSILAVVLRLRAPGDAAGRGTIIPEYSLPEDINLFEAGNLVGRTKESTPATLVSLAVRGNIQIIDEGDKKDFSLRYLTDNAVDGQEQELLTAIFGPTRKRGMSRGLTKVDTKRAALLQKVLASTKDAVLARGWRMATPVPGGAAVFIALVVLVVAAIGVCIAAAILSPVVTVSAIVVTPVAVIGAVIAAFCAFRSPILTDAGARLRDYIEGMRVYLKLAEAERFRVLQSPEGALRVDVADHGQVVKLYEKLLPYAVLWGVEKEWSEELATQYEEQPDWYVGPSGFNSALFGASMHSFSTTTVSAATPTYSGSGGGSFSGGSMGGGFSGGGGGGGGGGGR
ncbi:MAG: DUF2207 domain-containing protein [Glaciihabitans sp.]